MQRFPRDAPREKVIKALKRLSFEIVREGNHIAMLRKNLDGTSTPLTLPNHKIIKASTLQTILNQSSITRQDFLEAFYSKGWWLYCHLFQGDNVC
jgi:predicted RNA binding protein YcfA (HicA-like mRNA interferase family)